MGSGATVTRNVVRCLRQCRRAGALPIPSIRGPVRSSAPVDIARLEVEDVSARRRCAYHKARRRMQYALRIAEVTLSAWAAARNSRWS